MQNVEWYYLLYRTSYNELACWALDQQRLLYPVRPKMHQFEHICLDVAPLINPRFVQCIMDEDLMRRVKAITLGVHANVYAKRALEHYSVALALRWTRGIS